MNLSLFKDAWLETKNTWQQPPGWNWTGERYYTREVSFVYDEKFFHPNFLSSLFWKVKREGQKLIARNNISIYVSKFITLKNLSQLLLRWLLCCSKDLSCLLAPFSFTLSTSNSSNILSDIESVNCTYSLLHFLLGSTHCSLSAKVKVEDTQPSSFHCFLHCSCSLWFLSPVWIS